MNSVSRKYIIINVAYILISAAVYLINRTALCHLDFPVFSYLCRCYLNDYLCGGVFISYLNLLLALSKRPPIHSLCRLLIVTLMAGIFWEYLAPLFLRFMTSDFWDIPAYLLGCCMYCFIMKIIFKHYFTTKKEESLYDSQKSNR